MTESERLRLDVCLPVPADTEVSGDVSKMTLPAGQCAIARFEISPEDYRQIGDSGPPVVADSTGHGPTQNRAVVAQICHILLSEATCARPPGTTGQYDVA